MADQKPKIKSFDVSSGINVGPFNIRLCSPVAEKVKELEVCSPNVEIEFRNPNELIAELFETASACSPACGICHPDTCKPGASLSGTCAPAVMSLGSVIERLIDPVVDRQKEMDKKIKSIMENVKKIESKLKK